VEMSAVLWLLSHTIMFWNYESTEIENSDHTLTTYNQSTMRSYGIYILRLKNPKTCHKFCHMQDIFLWCIAFHSTCSFFVLCASEVCFVYFYGK
jgi:hypothetical protein